MQQIVRFVLLIAFLALGLFFRTWWGENHPAFPALVLSVLPLAFLLFVAVIGQSLHLFKGSTGKCSFSGALLLVAVGWSAMGLATTDDGWVRILPVLFAFGMARLSGAHGSIMPVWFLFGLLEAFLTEPVLTRIREIVSTAFPQNSTLLSLPTISVDLLVVELIASLLVALSLLFFASSNEAPIIVERRPRRERTKEREEEESEDEEPSKPRKKRNKKGFFTDDAITQETLDPIVVREDQNELDEVLSTMLFFLSKNFRSFSALGFLSNDNGKTFRLAAFISQESDKILKDVSLQHNQGLVGKSSQRQGGLCTGNLRSYNDAVEYYSERPLINSLMVSRIIDTTQKQVLGLLVVDSQMKEAFFQDHKNLLDRFSTIASQLISNVSLSQRLKRLSWRNERAYQMALYFAKQSDTNEILKGIVGSYPATFDADRFWMFDQVGGEGRLFFTKGTSEKIALGKRFDLKSSGVVQEVFQSGKTVHRQRGSNVGRYSSEDLEVHPIMSLMAGPLLNDSGEVIAVMVVEKKSEHFYSHDACLLFETLNTNASTAFAKAQTMQRLERQATTDGLTGIANHRQFQMLLDQSLARRQRDGNSLALLLMDIDHFKQFNDRHGHQLGDQVLKQVANALRRTIRAGDSVARYGGEEFVVILETAGFQEALLLAERIREAVEAVTIPHRDQQLQVTISIGVAIYPNDATVKSELIENADQALYASKDAGRNCVTLFHSLKPKEGAVVAPNKSSFLEKDE